MASVATERLTELELELLERCSMSPETTTTLHEEMLESPLDRGLVESALLSLLERGLMLTYRGFYVGAHRPRADPPENRVYEDDWWELTPAGHETVKSA
jgi:hypothetical protein